MNVIRPMLAAAVDFDKLKYPCWIQGKIDGIRALAKDGTALSRTAKPIPNQHIRRWFMQYGVSLNGLDGELITYNPSTGKIDDFNTIQSYVMSEAGNPTFKYIVFDMWDIPIERYSDRLSCVRYRVARFSNDGKNPDGILAVVDPTIQVHTHEQLLAAHDSIVSQGFEGSIIRHSDTGYKYGRSTAKQGALLKLKVWEDDEARVIGFEELMHNDNELQQDAFGLAKRSAHIANQRPGNMLGKLVVEHPMFGEFRIGSGFDMALRQVIWDSRDAYLGRLVTFKYQPFGMKDKPRAPIFKGFRSELDVGEPK